MIIYFRAALRFARLFLFLVLTLPAMSSIANQLNHLADVVSAAVRLILNDGEPAAIEAKANIANAVVSRALCSCFIN